MVDRLSTLQIFQSGISTILQRQAELDRTQQELATGKRILSPSDDPGGAVRILDLQEDIARIDQFQRNAAIAEGKLAYEETTLDSVSTVLQRVRELTVQANNATQTPETRAAIGAEVRERLAEVIDLANTRDGNDEYIFGGFQSRSQPFTLRDGEVSYRGDDGQRFLDIAAGVQVAVRDPGSGVFLDVPAGNGRFDISVTGNDGTAVVSEFSADGSFSADDYTITFTRSGPSDPIVFNVTDGAGADLVPPVTGVYTPGEAISFNGARVVVEGAPADGDVIEIVATPRQSIFETLDEIATALETATGTPANSAEINNALASGLVNLDQAIGKILEVQAEVGVRLNRIESQKQINEDFNLQLQTTLSDVEDVDFAEAISRLNLQLVALQAAQQTYVTTQRLSLFDFL
jgi:flagellar hook-associated protein 3 FlgL